MDVKGDTRIVHDVFLTEVINFLETKIEVLQPRAHRPRTGLEHTAAVSTPVGPPPQMTKLSSLLRSSGVVVGSEAVSKLSLISR